MAILDVVVVGAGQAGLGVSYYLQRAGLDHVVFERGRIGETWLSQRWDSFKLNTPNVFNTLPGLPYDGAEPDGFWGPAEFVAYLQRYALTFQLPVRIGVNVVAVEQADDGLFAIKTAIAGVAQQLILSRAVVLASGYQNTPRIPLVGTLLPAEIHQLHASSFRNAAALPPGAVVVVGSGQSGCQIAEDLLTAGRTVYLCTSKVGRAPRRYRGRDVTLWLSEMGLFDVSYASLEDKSVSQARQPQVSGLGRYGHTISLQQLARQGAVILGRLLNVRVGEMILGDDAADHVRFGDAFSLQVKSDVDAYLARSGITPPPLEDDPADAPDPQAACASPLRRLSLAEAHISTVIWTTGFGADLHWVHLPTVDAANRPIHQEGVAPVRGLYFIGCPWLRTGKSGIIYGAGEDAASIAQGIITQLTEAK